MESLGTGEEGRADLGRSRSHQWEQEPGKAFLLQARTEPASQPCWSPWGLSACTRQAKFRHWSPSLQDEVVSFLLWPFLQFVFNGRSGGSTQENAAMLGFEHLEFFWRSAVRCSSTLSAVCAGLCPLLTRWTGAEGGGGRVVGAVSTGNCTLWGQRVRLPSSPRLSGTLRRRG